MVSKIGALHDPLFNRPRRLQSSKILDTGVKISTQRVDSKFNDLESTFRTTHANVAALYYSCENYKVSLKSFFYRSINLLELFRSTLEDDTESSHNCFTPVSPKLAFGTPIFERLKEGKTEVLQDFYIASGLPNKLRDFCISRLSKQMYVIARRLEDDFLFFKNGVQQPLKDVLHVCANISRIIEARNNANVELMAIQDSINEQERFLQESAGSNSGTPHDPLHSDPKLQDATTRFEILNSLLKDNLKSFRQLINSFMEQWFKVYYYTTIRISYALYHSSWSSPEFKKVAFGQQSQTQEDSISDTHILSTFHAQHDVVAREVEGLTIARFRDVQDPVADTEIYNRLMEPFSLGRYNY